MNIKLIETNNIQLVCFDRDYTYENQIYRIRSQFDSFDVVDVTEIDDRDARMIIDSIPASAQKTKTTMETKKTTAMI